MEFYIFLLLFCLTQELNYAQLQTSTSVIDPGRVQQVFIQLPGHFFFKFPRWSVLHLILFWDLCRDFKLLKSGCGKINLQVLSTLSQMSVTSCYFSTGNVLYIYRFSFSNNAYYTWRFLKDLWWIRDNDTLKCCCSRCTDDSEPTVISSCDTNLGILCWSCPRH